MKTLLKIAISIVTLAISHSHAQEVYKCGNTYSDEPCKGAVVIDASPPVSDNAGPRTKLIYLCKRPDTSQPWWIHEECSRRRWTVIDSVRVPSNIRWDDQVAIAERKRAEKAKRPKFTPRYSTPAPANDNNRTCENLNKRVAELDSMGRAGGTARRMEWIRAERQSARDKQFQLRC
jgi:hypothetical protein